MLELRLVHIIDPQASIEEAPRQLAAIGRELQAEAGGPRAAFQLRLGQVPLYVDGVPPHQGLRSSARARSNSAEALPLVPELRRGRPRIVLLCAHCSHLLEVPKAAPGEALQHPCLRKHLLTRSPKPLFGCILGILQGLRLARLQLLHVLRLLDAQDLEDIGLLGISPLALLPFCLSLLLLLGILLYPCPLRVFGHILVHPDDDLHKDLEV
mmetsp:Transcript_20629/g.44870  ORF Transcript_20629/g.44870 Transcript_20629/m.44870 type:complete len:211 (+) Transcript_20629:692-1324(+)